MAAGTLTSRAGACRASTSCGRSTRASGGSVRTRVDAYVVHRVDPETPLEETLEALDQVVRAGKARSIGYSNWPAWLAAAAIGLQRANGWAEFSHGQMYYSLLGRDVERDSLAMMRHFGLGMSVWSPLAYGFLAGGYTPEDMAKDDNRFGKTDWLRFDRDKAFALLPLLRSMAAAKQCSMAQLALAWLLHRDGVSTVLIGATKPHQLADNLGAVDVALSADDLAQLDAATAQAPHLSIVRLGRIDAAQKEAGMTAAPAPGALSGITIVEIAERPAGECTGKLLADFGAEVIKVERPGGAPTRAMGPHQDGQSAVFGYFNTNKKSVVLDLADPADRAQLDRLLARANALIDDHDEAWGASRGLTAGEIAGAHPHLVHCIVTPFGQGAPAEWQKARPINVINAGGWAYHTPSEATPEMPPLKGAGRFLPDYEVGDRRGDVHARRAPPPARRQRRPVHRHLRGRSAAQPHRQRARPAARRRQGAEPRAHGL